MKDTVLIESIRTNLTVLKDRKDELDKASRDQLNGLRELIEGILDYSKQELEFYSGVSFLWCRISNDIRVDHFQI